MKLSELPVGSRIYFGKYQVNEEEPEAIIWRLVDKDLYNNLGSVTLITDKIIDLRCFDSLEPSNTDENRQKYGNNRYSQSNIDQWLNSNQKEWYTPQHSTDSAPGSVSYSYSYGTSYKDKEGFLYNFTEEEINCIIPSKIRVCKNNVNEDGSYEDIIRKVFLPSLTELGLSDSSLPVEENTTFEYYNTGTTRETQVTEQCYNNTKSSNKPQKYDNTTFISYPWKYWFRTPSNTSTYQSREISSNYGTLSSDACYRGDVGIRPVITLNGDLMILQDGTSSGGIYSVFASTKNKKLSELPVGSTVQFGKYQVNIEIPEKIIWTIVDQNHEGYPDNSTTLITEKIIDQKAFDAKELNSSNSQWAAYGCNIYKYSNIHQWLNSDKLGNYWYTSQHENDAAPTDQLIEGGSKGYNSKNGFLYNFTKGEKASILDTTIKTSPTGYLGNASSSIEDLICKVFLPSRAELGYATPTEGTVISHLQQNLNTELSQQFLDNTTSDSLPSSSANLAWRYWTRTRNTQSGSYDGYCYSQAVASLTSGSQVYDGATGIRPIVNLSNNIEASFDSLNGFYIINIYEWSEEWTYNSTHHWHECLGDECPEDMLDEQKSGYAPHAPSDWQIIKEPTDFERGIKIKTCTVCGYETDRQIIPKLTERVLELQPLDAIKTNRVVTEMYSNTLITCESEYAISIEACNNGFDNNPTWEDITEPVLKKKKATLSNDTKTADDWGVNIKITLSKETGTAPLVLDGLVFSYN